jgi:hypothetical protein
MAKELDEKQDDHNSRSCPLYPRKRASGGSFFDGEKTPAAII